MKRHPRSDTRTHRNRVGVVAEIEPFRDRNIRTRIVPCPDCKVGVGEPCVDAEGNRRSNSHGVRRRMAIRALNNQTND
jgi:hypothetical protein